MAQVLSGCAVRAAIQQEQALPDEERHYLGAVLLRLKTLYELTKESSVREQISDEVDWLEERLGRTMTAQQDDRTPISRDTPASPRAEGE